MRALIDALRDPEAYPWPVGEVEVLQTHISCLFFAGNYVLKVKKPIVLDFLDYGTLDRRRHFCEEEVRLNRPLAPRVYHGAVPIARAAGGGLRVDSAGEIAEWGVKMARLPEERMLSRLLASGTLPDGWIDAVAGLLAAFHASAATGPGVDEHGTPAAVERKILANLAGLRPFVGAPLAPALCARLERWARDDLAALRDLLARRVAAGRIREGHGDLHAGNICFPPGGIVVYDRIEFSRDLRCDDVACDLAFLAMDLDARGHAGESSEVVRRYARAAEDAEATRLVPFYARHRAAVRAKVAALAAAEPEFPPDRAAEMRAEARRYVALAVGSTLPPSLILTCGLPGTGKSWAARRLARPLRAEVLRSDVVRKEIAGIPPERRARADYGAGLYSAERTRATYRRLLERAGEAIASGRSAIVDASFPSRALRRPFVRSAAALGCPVVLVHLTAPEEVVRRRLRARTGDASDAGADVYLRARTAFEPPEEIDRRRRVDVDSVSASEEDVADAVIESLAAR